MSKPRLVPSEVTLASVDDYTAFVKHPAIPASYTILKEDSTYYALPCFSGGTKYSGADAFVVTEAVVNALLATGGKIFLKNGTYDWGANSLNPTLVTGKPIEIEGESWYNTIITGSGTTMVNIQNAAWSGVKIFSLKNLYLSHTMSSTNDITLDLRYCHPFLERVTCYQVGYTTTHYGKAIYTGPSGGAGLPVVYKQICGIGYERFLVDTIDHSTVMGAVANYPSARAFLFGSYGGPHFCYGLEHNVGDEYPTVYTLDFADGVHAMIYGVKIETGSDLTQAIINAYGSIGNVEIWGLDCSRANQKLSEGGEMHHIHIHGNGQYIIVENSGTATFSGTGAQTVFTIAHGCVIPPTQVNLEAKSAGASGVKYWSADATNITVTFITAPPSGTNNVVIGWKAEV